jgi:hypothetical protein
MRIALAGTLSLVLSGGLISLVVAFLDRGEETEPDARPVAQENQPVSRVTEPPASVPTEDLSRKATAPAADPPPAEKPIEDLLAESGEDPGAVYYMSRVREAIHEGNPAFARELLGHMKREHADSILVLEAERLLE